MKKEQLSILNKIPLMNLEVCCLFFDDSRTAHFVEGGNLNAASRQALMQKLARTDQPAPRPEPT